MAAPCIDCSPSYSPAYERHTIHPLAKLRSHSRGGATLSDDSLTTYMNQIRRIELLSRKEQDQLARAYAHDGDIEAGKTLIWSNLRLVIKIARDFHRKGQDLMELIQEGNLGLSEALIRFDPDKGTPFVGYAHFWIRAMILNHLLTLSRPVRLGSSRDSRKLFFNLKKARRAVISQGLEPTAENVAEYLDVDLDEVHRMGALLDGGGVVYLDAPAFGDEEDGAQIIDFLPDSTEDVTEDATRRLFQKQLRKIGDDFKETLPDERRVTIWNERMIAMEPKQLQELGDDFGVSKERIRQIEMDIRRRFQLYLEKELGDELQDHLDW